MLKRILVIGLLALFVPAALATDKENAAQAFAAGKTALKAADFTKALEQFKNATRGDPDNQQYFNAYTLLRRVIKMREQVTKEMEAEAWQQFARQLYAYYHENGISTELVSLATTLCATLADSATNWMWIVSPVAMRIRRLRRSSSTAESIPCAATVLG